MRAGFATFLLLLASSGLSGCTTIHRIADDELHYPGGIASRIADQYYVVSANNSKELQLYRYALALALFSRAATANIQNGKDADTFISGMQGSMQEIDFSAGHLFLANKASLDECIKKGESEDQCKEYRSTFESDLPLVENKLVNVGFDALPKEEAVALYSAARRMDPVATGRAFVALALNSLLTFHRAAAVHRTNLELLGPVMGEADGDNTTVLKSYCFLRQTSPNAKKDRLCANVIPTGTYAQRAITIEDFEPIAAIIRTSCLILPVNAESDKADPVADRRKECAALKFSPKRRLEILPKAEAEAADQPAVATDKAVKPVATTSGKSN